MNSRKATNPNVTIALFFRFRQIYVVKIDGRLLEVVKIYLLQNSRSSNRVVADYTAVYSELYMKHTN